MMLLIFFHACRYNSSTKTSYFCRALASNKYLQKSMVQSNRDKMEHAPQRKGLDGICRVIRYYKYVNIIFHT